LLCARGCDAAASSCVEAGLFGASVVGGGGAGAEARMLLAKAAVVGVNIAQRLRFTMFCHHSSWTWKWEMEKLTTFSTIRKGRYHVQKT
jgi:hypothetical protein